MSEDEMDEELFKCELKLSSENDEYSGNSEMILFFSFELKSSHDELDGLLLSILQVKSSHDGFVAKCNCYYSV